MAKQQRKEITFGGLSNNMDESIESEANSWASMNTWHDKGLLEGIRRYKNIGQRSSPNAADVALGQGYGKVTSNEIQKLVMSGGPTGGTFTLTYSAQTTATIAYNCTASAVQLALEALSNINVGDIIVTGGPFPGLPIEVEWVGQFKGTDVALMTDNSASLTGGSSPDVAVTEKRKGGSHEVYYAVVQPSGSGDATLYAITSSDSFETTTWSSIATDLDPTDWFFDQYGDRILFCNSVDGLKWLYIGSTALGAAGPAPPGNAPAIAEDIADAGTSEEWATLSTTSWAATGIAVAPTIAAGNGSLLVTFNAAETNFDLVLTGTLAADQDFSLGRDVGQLMFDDQLSDCGVMGPTMKMEYVNADGSPLTIVPDYWSRALNSPDAHIVWRYFHFADEVRVSRDNVDKVIIRLRMLDVALNSKCLINLWLRRTWPNDTRSLVIDPPANLQDPDATNAAIEYCYSYYDTSEALESGFGPVASSQVVPSQDSTGCWMTLTAIGSSALNTTDDRVFFYRKEKATGKWRRLPNTANISTVASYGAVNATASSPTMTDTWMEHELANFPESDAVGFPPNNTGASADVLGVWKQCLAVGSGKLSYLSWVGQPLRYEPSPDTIGYVSPDPDQFPDVGVTEYVSDNRAEKVYALVGQDSLYAVTPLSAYAKVGDSPATASVFRRLPGSRGTLSKRAVYRYGGGILIGSLDGLWYYSVGRGFSGEDNGALVEREETGGSATTGAPGVRRSYQRLISELQSIQLTGTELDGTFSLTWDGYTTAEIAVDATPLDVKRALEDLMNSYRAYEGFVPNSIDEVEVFGEDLVDADGNGGGIMYVRFMGAYGATNVAAMTGSVTNVTGNDEAITIDTVTSGIQTNLIVFEFNDEYWLINQKSWLYQSRSRKWSEGIWTDSIKAIIANRERGIVMLTSDGKLMKIKDGLFGDGLDSTPIRWQYESPWMTGPRAGVLGVQAVVQGAPTFRLYSDDGAGSVDAYGANSPHSMTITLEENKMRTLPASNLPGIRHKIIVSGVTGRDKVKSLALNIQPEGDGTGS